jgi:hypothetical protein
MLIDSCLYLIWKCTADSLVRRTLDLIEGMWIGQALQERQFDSWFTQLIAAHRDMVKEKELYE